MYSLRAALYGMLCWPGGWLATLAEYAGQRQLQCSRHDVHVLRRRQMVDAMFRRYGFAGVQVQIQAVLTLYSQGGLWLPQHIVICCSTKCAFRITRQLEPSIPDLPHL